MKKKVLIFLVLILIFASPIYAAASLEEKLGNHWSKNEIERDFLLYYFPYLAKDNFNRLNLKEAFYEDEFLLSFSSLLKEKGYTRMEIGWKEKLTRIDMVKLLAEKLLEIGAIELNQEPVPFKDLEGVPIEKKETLQALYHAGLINGQSNFKFNPYAHATQGEVIILLQRVDKLLDEVNKTENAEEDEIINIPFTLSGIVQSYSGVEGINSKIGEDKVYVTITKEFSTTGYSMGVDKILKEKDEYKIYLNITPPSKDSEQLMVITFKTITIEINKQDLGLPPYKFVWVFLCKFCG
ncbi:S-layer homology domain-containing protein [Tepidimicrobium xylanilyticum]|uniref:S-layer homology domain-containing protein n=1 Tax=Tepidimicrobium xylanilyticum TaxID=1123352 RepID=UPI00264F75A3|nr:S-layer homology domain-containing protein [Tepidimicrobium xylanilyticum]GMG95448.1 hypothetical protein EN5CB1_02740 [Tepidimicrobium xylanilyticum]